VSLDCIRKTETREKNPSMVLAVRAYEKRHFSSGDEKPTTGDDRRTRQYINNIVADISA
jgi:hypothetical protein